MPAGAEVSLGIHFRFRSPDRLVNENASVPHVWHVWHILPFWHRESPISVCISRIPFGVADRAIDPLHVRHKASRNWRTGEIPQETSPDKMAECKVAHTPREPRFKCQQKVSKWRRILKCQLVALYHQVPSCSQQAVHKNRVSVCILYEYTLE